MKNSILLLLLLIFNFNTFAQIPPHISTNGLIGYWGFNSNANDESGNGNHGTVSNATLTTDRFGKANSAYLFNGKDSRIDVNKAFFDIGWNEYTISCWINSTSLGNPNNYNDSQIIFNTNPHNGIGISKHGSDHPFNPIWDNKYVFVVNSNPTVRNWDVIPENGYSNTNQTINVWNHLVLIKQNNTYKLYLNGVLERTVIGDLSVNQYFTKTVFGNISPEIADNEVTAGFWGKLDDFTIWNRGLSQTEITSLFNSTSATQNTDLSLTSKSLNQTVRKDSTGQISFALKNQSTNAATNIKVLLKIPYTPPFVIKNSQNCTKGTFDSNMWTVPELAPGDSCVLNVIYQPAQSGVWYVEAEVFSADQEDTDSTPKNGIDTEDDFTRACLTMPISITTEPFGMQLMLEDPKIIVAQWYKNGTAIVGENKNTLQITALGKYNYSSNTYKCPDQGCCPFIIEKAIVAPNCCSPLEFILERKN